MERNRRRIILILALFVLTLMFTAEKLAKHFSPGGGGMDKTAMREMLGTFKDPQGKEDNSICFELVPSPIKTGSALGTVQARKGSGHLHKLFGYEDMDFIWGYCEWDPRLIISIVPLDDTKAPEQKNRLGSLQITALGHTALQIKPLSVQQRNDRLTDLFKTNEPVISVMRTMEAKYPPPNF